MLPLSIYGGSRVSLLAQLWVSDVLAKPYILPLSSSVSAFQMPNMEYLSRSLSRVILESSSDFLNYRNSPGSSYLKKKKKKFTRLRYCEDVGLSAVSRIYVEATLKLFVLFDSESREPLLGTVKYALAHFSLALSYVSA